MPAVVACRVYFEYVELKPDRIRRDGYYQVFHCPVCSAFFPVRDGDASSMGIGV